MTDEDREDYDCASGCLVSIMLAVILMTSLIVTAAIFAGWAVSR